MTTTYSAALKAPMVLTPDMVLNSSEERPAFTASWFLSALSPPPICLEAPCLKTPGESFVADEVTSREEITPRCYSSWLSSMKLLLLTRVFSDESSPSSMLPISVILVLKVW